MNTTPLADITVSLGNTEDLLFAQKMVTKWHYLARMVDWRARPMAYIVSLGDKPAFRVGVIMVGIPHATKNKKWWGYPGLITQWQVVDLCRIWMDPRIQAGGEWCNETLIPGFVDRRGVWRPRTASWAIERVLDQVQRDRVSLWPPVYPDQPYHIRLAISYHDPKFHKGTIYRKMGWTPMYRDDQGDAVLGSSGKFGWCWPLAEPQWGWEEIKIRQPRTMRLALDA
jgi:hypothetical protein